MTTGTTIDSRSQAPYPVPDRDTEAFWDAAADRRLVVQRCAGCERWIWQPRPLCPGCHGEDLPWTEVSGDGTITSFTVIHPPVLPAWGDDVPFALLLVELDEGVRMIGRLVNDDGAVVRIPDGGLDGLATGTPVRLRWTEQAGVNLPAWTLAT